VDKVQFFYINLEDNAERRLNMLKQASDLGIELIRIDAVDGRGRPTCSGALTPIEDAIFRSHLKTWKTIAESDRSAVVFEDDVTLTIDLPLIVDELSKLDVDLVRLEHRKKRLGWYLTSLMSGKYSLEETISFRGVSGAGATYLSPTAAKKLVRIAESVPGRFPLDDFLDGYHLVRIPRLLVRPSVVLHNRQFGSTNYRARQFTKIPQRVAREMQRFVDYISYLFLLIFLSIPFHIKFRK
jgi:GR25 family glycosyltransferase involved in LPS biosynthesis